MRPRTGVVKGASGTARPAVIVVLLVVSGVIGLGLVARGRPPGDRRCQPPRPNPRQRLRVVPNLQACHPGEYAAWHASYHRTMTQVATPESVVSDFEHVSGYGHGPAPPRIERQMTPFGSQPIGTQVVDTKAAEFGISCEACHGPSEEHARLNRSPLRRYLLHLSDRPDPSTVQPL